MTEYERLREIVRDAIAPTEQRVRELHDVRFKRGPDGGPPDGVRLDRLEQAEGRRARLTWAGIGVAMTAMGSIVVGWIKG